MLTAPVSGTVQELQTHTMGGVVTPAQPIKNIVPSDQHCCSKPGSNALHVFFGTSASPKKTEKSPRSSSRKAVAPSICEDRQLPLHQIRPDQGTIQKISDDAVAEDTPNGPQYGFTAHVALDQQTVLVENQTVVLQPVMTAQADIKTGQRRLIEFVLAPLLRASAESMRKR